MCGAHWPLPFYINAMTGGTKTTGEVNAALARAAAATGAAIACGSQHIAVRSPQCADGFEVIRREAPDAYVLANVGPTISPLQARCAVEMIGANALQVHLNVAQELVMPEGDRDFRDWDERLTAITQAVGVPVIVKEVGFGLSLATIEALAACGASAADVAGTGGTDFVAIENERRPSKEYSHLSGWGQSTALCLLESVCGPRRAPLPVLASGGVRTPLDVARALALGARAVGVSGHFLRTVMAGGSRALEEELSSWRQQLRIIMTLVGALDVPGLRRTDILVTGATAERARLLGVDLEALARRSRG